MYVNRECGRNLCVIKRRKKGIHKTKKFLSLLLVCIFFTVLSTNTFAADEPLLPQDNPTGYLYEQQTGDTADTKDARLAHAVTLSATRTLPNTVQTTLQLIPTFGYPIVDNALITIYYRDGSGPPIATASRSTGSFGPYVLVREGFAISPTATSGYAQAIIFFEGTQTVVTNSF